MLSKQALQEFKAIWKEEIGEEISDDLALEKATELLTLFNVVYRPIRKKWLKKYDNGRTKKSIKG